MTPYQLWQKEKYGNILPDDTDEEIENGTERVYNEGKKINEVEELRLLSENNF